MHATALILVLIGLTSPATVDCGQLSVEHEAAARDALQALGHDPDCYEAQLSHEHPEKHVAPALPDRCHVLLEPLFVCPDAYAVRFSPYHADRVEWVWAPMRFTRWQDTAILEAFLATGLQRRTNKNQTDYDWAVTEYADRLVVLMSAKEDPSENDSEIEADGEYETIVRSEPVTIFMAKRDLTVMRIQWSP